MIHSDVIIIGGGILGLSHAYHALSKGLSVRLFEKDSSAVGSSIQNFGQIVPSGFGAKWQKYGRRSLSFYESIQNEFDIHIRKEGSIYIASNDEELCLIEELYKLNKANDYSSQLLTAGDCLSRYPKLRKEYCKGALLFEQEYNADSRWTIPSITQYLVAKFHLYVHFNTRITTLDIEKNKVIVADYKNNKWSADKIIICNGSDFKSLLPNIYADSNIELVKLQMLETVPQLKQGLKGSILTGWTIRRYESFKECPSFQAIKVKEDKHSYQQKFGIHILFKQLASGAIIIGDSHEYSSIENESALKLNEIDYGMNEFMLTAAKDIMDLDYTISKSWVGLYSQSKTDELFTKNIENKIYIATAIGGKGMTGSLGWAEEHISRIFE